MIRSSAKFPIFFEDLKSGDVQVYNFTFKGKHYVEYWIYKSEKINTGIYDMYGHPIKRRKGKKVLEAIICCPTTHITKKTSEYIHVAGHKFSNDRHGNHVNEYLRRTGRTTI
jgi:hypothetical protein